MFTLPTEPQNCFGVLESSLKFWKTHYTKLLLTVLASIILGSIPGLIFPKVTLATYHITMKIILMNWWYVLVFLVVMFFLFGFILHQVYCLLNNKKTTIRESLLIALKKLPYLIISYFIYVAVVTVGLFAMLIPGIGLLILLSMYLPLIIIENKGPISGFKESWDLTNNEWTHTFFVLLILTIAIILATMFINLIGNELWVFAHPAGYGVLPLGHRILKIAVDMVFFPIYVTTIMMLLHDLQLRQQLKIDHNEPLSP